MPKNSRDSVLLTLSGSPQTNVEADGEARQASCGRQRQAGLDVAGHLRACLRGHRAVLPVDVFGLEDRHRCASLNLLPWPKASLRSSTAARSGAWRGWWTSWSNSATTSRCSRAVTPERKASFIPFGPAPCASDGRASI